jgi:hypothetical protein
MSDASGSEIDHSRMTTDGYLSRLGIPDGEDIPLDQATLHR